MAPPEIVIHPRSQSIASGGLMSPPLLVTPEPEYIAAAAGSQIVTNDRDSQAEIWYDQNGIQPSGEGARVSQPALRLVNRFLDLLLFSFLSGAKSISLTSLRPAVSEVLKPKLAHGAISGADQELHEYLGDGDDAQIMAYHNDSGLEADGDWDVELVWKRTRLRCMVYSSLGDMEEEDEDIYMQQEHLGMGSNGANAGEVSPAVAIFLTSILEFIGEQVLMVAGQAAYQRMKAKYEKEARDGTGVMTEIAERIVVEDTDVEKVALDRTLGRLWRSYKKRVRSPTTSVSLTRSFSRESLQTQLARQANNIYPEEPTDEALRPSSLAGVLSEYEFAAVIPLPMSDDDVREIEIPGLAAEIDDDSDATTIDEETSNPRAKSMLYFSQLPLTPTSDGEAVDSLPVSRKRSHSVPTPDFSPDPSKRLKSTDSEIPAEGEVNELEGQDKSGMTGLVAGVVAAGTVAAAGIVSVVQGKAPQTEYDDRSEIDSDDEETEEAVILTARVSVGGSSPNEIGLSRGSSIRSRSGHSSVRVIDVAPSLSRNGSIKGARVGSRPTSIQGPASAGTQSPRVSSPMTRGGSNRSSLVRNSSIGDAHSSEESITEEKEAYESEGALITAIPAELAAAMHGVDVDFNPSHQIAKPLPKQQFRDLTHFKLSAAPIPRKSPSRSPTRDQISGSMQSNQSVFGNKAPSLTPLRELMEVAPDTSDEASSMAPSYDTYSTKNSHPPSSLNPAKRVGDTQKPLRALNTNLPRAPSGYSAEASRKRSASVQKSPHHSSSGSDATSHKYLARRASEDGSVAESKGPSFEELIRSDTTIQYTLTPENMRNIESPDSPRANGSIKQNAQDVPRPGTSRSGSSSNRYMAALRSNPVEGNRVVKQSVSAANIGSKLRHNAPQPRDARAVDRDSIGDFADFIRSTGPANSYENGPRNLHSHRGANGTPRNYSGAVARTTAQANLPRRAESSAGRLKLQAREAVVPRGDSISDLIDFVRSGPQVDKGGHRIPRTVAPFRTTMDSDQMSVAVGGKAIDANLPEPRSSQASNSVQGSVTSQSGLLKNAAMNKPLPVTHHNDFDEADMMPKRKTRRVRDPYAIDYSDEEEEDYMPTPKPIIKEESLADFLRSVPPPPSPPIKTSSVFDSIPEPPRKDIKKKSSTTALISRFGRRATAGDAPPVPKPPKTSSGSSHVLQKPRTSHGSAPAAQKPKTSSGTESRSTSRTGVNSNVPVVPQLPNLPKPSERDNYAPQGDTLRPLVQRKAYQPREAVAKPVGRSSDLADFLMSHEPPPRAATQPLILTSPILTSPKQEGSTFQRMFGRKKVH